MSLISDDEGEVMENIEDFLENMSKELQSLHDFRDMFFENHDISLAEQKYKLLDEKKNVLIEKIEAIDENIQIPQKFRSKFLYLKGRLYNVSSNDVRAAPCLSKALKLNPNMVEAWNELGECHWKNFNIKEAKASFEGALKHERNALSLRSLSIILRQGNAEKTKSEQTQAVLKGVELAKEAVSLDIKDGLSWTILGNAYLCQFFTISQDSATLKLCMSAYKQAMLDPIAKGQPDLYYNKGIALKYEEHYPEAFENFDYACRLDPSWDAPKLELNKLVHYLMRTDELVRTKGKIKQKKLSQMGQNIDKRSLGPYTPGSLHSFGSRRDVTMRLARLDELQPGANEGLIVLGRVVGSIRNENAVPFTFAIVDESMQCVCVTVYNWADGRGAIIGDCIAIPEPHYNIIQDDCKLATYNFKSIRVNNPMLLLINGKRVGREQFACTRVSSTYEIH